MKKISFLLILIISVLGRADVQAQNIRLSEGTIPAWGKDWLVNVEFSYEKMQVGSFTNEEDYIERNVTEFNKIEPGRGDRWAEHWKDDRKNRREPAFTSSLSENGFIIDDQAPYTIIFHTVFTEPGFHAGPAKKRATINAEVYIVSTTDKNKILAKVSIMGAQGKASGYDTGERIARCYNSAAKMLAKFLKNASK